MISIYFLLKIYNNNPDYYLLIAGAADTLHKQMQHHKHHSLYSQRHQMPSYAIIKTKGLITLFGFAEGLDVVPSQLEDEFVMCYDDAAVGKAKGREDEEDVF